MLGRYLVFGSAARDELRFDSDFDVLVDFPTGANAAAKNYAEAVSIELGLAPDVHLMMDASEELMRRVYRDAVVLQ